MMCHSHDGELVPAAHETFGPAVLRRPLRRIRVAGVIGLLDHARLILGRQQRQERRHLVVPRAIPVRLRVRAFVVSRPVRLRIGRVAGMHVAARPFLELLRRRLLLRAAALRRFGEQRLVVLLRRLERIRAHDRFARIVAVAMTPGGRRRPVVADRGRRVRAPLLLDAGRAVAAEIAWVRPELAVLVEVLRGEHVDGQRLHALRRRAVMRGADEIVPRAARDGAVREHDRDRRARDFVLAQVRGERPAAADALEAGSRRSAGPPRPLSRELPPRKWPPFEGSYASDFPVTYANLSLKGCRDASEGDLRNPCRIRHLPSASVNYGASLLAATAPRHC